MDRLGIPVRQRRHCLHPVCVAETIQSGGYEILLRVVHPHQHAGLLRSGCLQLCTALHPERYVPLRGYEPLRQGNFQPLAAHLERLSCLRHDQRAVHAVAKQLAVAVEAARQLLTDCRHRSFMGDQCQRHLHATDGMASIHLCTGVADLYLKPRKLRADIREEARAEPRRRYGLPERPYCTELRYLLA